MRTVILLAVAISCLTIRAEIVSAQGYYSRTSQRSPITGRQQIVDLQAPRWSGAGQGGFMFDAASGSLQVTAVSRNRATGRLEYHNRYLNPWTGARYTTSTQFNPYTNRYQTQHNFAPPVQGDQTARANASPKVVESIPRPIRRPRIIETKSSTEDAPTEINPPTYEPPVSPPAESSPSEAAEQPAEPAVTLEIRNP